MHGRRTASAAVAVLMGVTGMVVAAPPATAVGGNCEARVGKQVRNWLPDLYRPEAFCHSLQPDSKARGGLDLAFGPDAYTAWFTETKVWKTGHWDDYVGVRGAYSEIRHV
jgi:hypothetical protein